jgi:hypothetical protein
MNDTQFEMLMELGNNVGDAVFTFGLVYIFVGAIVSIVTASIIGNR